MVAPSLPVASSTCSLCGVISSKNPSPVVRSILLYVCVFQMLVDAGQDADALTREVQT